MHNKDNNLEEIFCENKNHFERKIESGNQKEKVYFKYTVMLLNGKWGVGKSYYLQRNIGGNYNYFDLSKSMHDSNVLLSLSEKIKKFNKKDNVKLPFETYCYNSPYIMLKRYQSAKLLLFLPLVIIAIINYLLGIRGIDESIFLFEIYMNILSIEIILLKIWTYLFYTIEVEKKVKFKKLKVISGLIATILIIYLNVTYKETIWLMPVFALVCSLRWVWLQCKKIISNFNSYVFLIGVGIFVAIYASFKSFGLLFAESFLTYFNEISKNICIPVNEFNIELWYVILSFSLGMILSYIFKFWLYKSHNIYNNFVRDNLIEKVDKDLHSNYLVIENIDRSGLGEINELLQVVDELKKITTNDPKNRKVIILVCDAGKVESKINLENFSGEKENSGESELDKYFDFQLELNSEKLNMDIYSNLIDRCLRTPSEKDSEIETVYSLRKSRTGKLDFSLFIDQNSTEEKRENIKLLYNIQRDIIMELEYEKIKVNNISMWCDNFEYRQGKFSIANLIIYSDIINRSKVSPRELNEKILISIDVENFKHESDRYFDAIGEQIKIYIKNSIENLYPENVTHKLMKLEILVDNPEEKVTITNNDVSSENSVMQKGELFRQICDQDITSFISEFDADYAKFSTTWMSIFSGNFFSYEAVSQRAISKIEFDEVRDYMGLICRDLETFLINPLSKFGLCDGNNKIEKLVKLANIEKIDPTILEQFDDSIREDVLGFYKLEIKQRYILVWALLIGFDNIIMYYELAFEEQRRIKLLEESKLILHYR